MIHMQNITTATKNKGVMFSLAESRLTFFSGPETSDVIEPSKSKQVIDVDTDALARQRFEQQKKLQETENGDRSQDALRQDELVQDIDSQPSREVLEAVSKVEDMYTTFARKWSADPDFGLQWNEKGESLAFASAEPLLQPIKEAWNTLRPGPERAAIEEALQSALLRATADTPNIQFHVSSGGGTLSIGGSRMETGANTSDQKSENNVSSILNQFPVLKKFVNSLRSIFSRFMMEKFGSSTLDQFNTKSTVATVSVSPGTTWGSQEVPSGSQNLEIRFKKNISEQQRSQFFDEVVHAANGDYGASANSEHITIQSLSPTQIQNAINAAKRWEQSFNDANTATDALQGIALLHREESLSSYTQLTTKTQQEFFRLVMSTHSLDSQVSLGKVLAKLPPIMTEYLAEGGPLHHPEIENFAPVVRLMSNEEKNAFKQLPIGDDALRLYFPDDRK